MPRNYRSITERRLLEAANASPRIRDKLIQQVIDSDPRARDMMERAERKSGRSSQFSDGLVHNVEVMGRMQDNKRAASYAARKAEAASAGPTPTQLAVQAAKELHETSVRKTETERKALNLTPKAYYEQFVAPLIDDMATRLAKGDDTRKAAYTYIAEDMIGLRNKDNPDPYQSAMYTNLRQGDATFISEISYFIGCRQRSAEARYHVDKVTLPAINQVTDRLLAEGHYTDRDAITYALDFYFSPPYLPIDYMEQNRLERRFHNGDPLRHAGLDAIKDMAAQIESNPTAFTDNLYKGLLERAAHRNQANAVHDIRKQELQAAVDNGWLPSAKAAEQAENAISAHPEIRAMQEAVHALRTTKVAFDGTVQVDQAARDLIQATIASPDAYRRTLQTALTGENAKLVAATTLAEAYKLAAGTLDASKAHAADIAASIADIREQGAVKRLLSVFTLASLHTEGALASKAQEQAQAAMTDTAENFERAKKAARDYIPSYAQPDDVLAYAPNLVPATGQTGAPAILLG